MKNLISLLLFLLFSWLGMWWYYSCDWCLGKSINNATLIEEKSDLEDLENEALTKKAYEDSIAAAKINKNGLFALDDQGNDIFRYSENFQINSSNDSVFIPESSVSFKDKIADYLDENQNKELILFGYETSKEKELNSDYGLGRANYIKNLLVQSGINEDRISTKIKSEDYTYDNTGVYNGGILFNFNTVDDKRLSEIEKGISNKVLYANFAEKSFTPDATLTNYAFELINYLNKYPNKNVQIIGHTDNVGSSEANLWYGKKRAVNVRDYLISQGLDTGKIEVSSMGESNPIAPNDSEENRAKNRRIEIIVN